MMINENLIVELERRKIVTATFRKLPPEKKEHIYKTAIEALSRESFDRVALDDIAGGAGISKGSLFQYFENKENLLEFVGEIFLDDYKKYWTEYFQKERAVRISERIKAFLIENIIQWQDRVTEFNFLEKQFNENPNKLAGSFIQLVNDLQKDHAALIIERGIETGELRGDISSGYMILMIQGLLEKLARVYSNRFKGRISEPRLENDIDKYVRILFEGISA